MLCLFDAHAHLADAPQPIQADAPGVTVAGRMLCAARPEEWNAVAGAAASWPGTMAAFGVHPWFISDAIGDWEKRLEQYLLDHPRAWLGEAGLDGLRFETSPEAEQKDVFARQLGLARRLGRQINLHCVKAYDALAAMLDAEYLGGGFAPPFIVHSFSGPHQCIEALTERGAYFTIGPLLSRRDSRRNRERAAKLPEDRLLLESDAPLTPPHDRPGDLAHSLAWLAAARGAAPERLAEAIANNTRRVFAHE